MKKLLLLLACTALSAGSFELTGEYLYWKPSSQGVYYGESGSKFLYVRPKYESGFRAEVVYQCECYDISASYIWVDSKREKRTKATLNFDPVGQGLNGAVAKASFDYQTADLIVGVRFMRGTERLLRLYLGIEGVDIEEKHDFLYSGTTRFRRKPSYRAVGPLMGLSAEYRLCGMLTVVGDVGVSALVGQRKFDNYPTDNIINPGFRVKIGLNYTYCFSCLALRGEIGYMARHYPNVLLEEIRRNNTLDISVEDVTYGGPYVALTLRF